jgi:hypothetical protein
MSIFWSNCFGSSQALEAGANELNAWVRGHAINARSLDDEELTIDTAYPGPESPAILMRFRFRCS